MDDSLLTSTLSASHRSHSNLIRAENSTRFSLIHQLVLSNRIQERTSTLLVTCFDAVAAVIVIAIVLRDANATFRINQQFDCAVSDAKDRLSSDEHTSPSRPAGLWQRLQHAEIFPLVTSFAIFAQAGIFIIVEAMGLQSLLLGNCRAISQIVWPCKTQRSIFCVTF